MAGSVRSDGRLCSRKREPAVIRPSWTDDGGFRLSKKSAGRKSNINSEKKLQVCRFLLLIYPKYCWPWGPTLLLSASCASYRIRRQSASGIVVFSANRAAIGIVTLRSPCVKHASVGCRAAHPRGLPKIFDRKREDFFVWKVEERSHTGVWQGMRQTKRGNIPFQERCCPNRFVRAYRGALLAPAAFQTASERVKNIVF